MKHLIAQQHHMEENTSTDEEEFIEERVNEVETMTRFVNDIGENKFSEDCCMKKTIKRIINYLVYKPLTYIESVMLCIYKFILMMTLLTIAVQYNMVEFCLRWIFVNILSENLIGLFSLIINAIIVMGLFDEIWQITEAFLCKCKKN